MTSSFQYFLVANHGKPMVKLCCGKLSRSCSVSTPSLCCSCLRPAETNPTTRIFLKLPCIQLNRLCSTVLCRKFIVILTSPSSLCYCHPVQSAGGRGKTTAFWPKRKAWVHQLLQGEIFCRWVVRVGGLSTGMSQIWMLSKLCQCL